MTDSRKWLKIAATVYVVLVAVAGFGGWLHLVVPRRFERLITLVGLCLIILAFRRRELKVWLVAFVIGIILALGLYDAFVR
jgi:hypothetical protein